MSGQLFDVINLVIAVGAFALAAVTAYWQHHKTDGLKVAFLRCDVRPAGSKETTALYLTFSLANTGTMPAIVSSVHYVLPHSDQRPDQRGETVFDGRDLAGRRLGPQLVAAGNLVQVDVRFELLDSEIPKGQLKDRLARLHLEVVNGRGDLVARQIEGFGVSKLETSGWMTVAPLGKTAIVLPKPDSDEAKPFTV